MWRPAKNTMESRSISLRVEPWAHQKEAISLAIQKNNFAFFMEMGTGKSLTTIGTILYHCQAVMAKTLIFCPPLVIPNWVNEFKKYSKVDPSLIQPLYGSGAKRLKIMVDSRAKIFITNYESLQMKDLFELFKAMKFEIIVFDESHKLKSTASKRSKLAYELANPWVFKRGPDPLKYILTGTPVLNTPMDIFQQFKILDGGETFGGNEWAFRAKYFVDRNRNMPSHIKFPKWEPKNLKQDGFDGKSEINRLIYSKAYRKTKEECLDLPPHLRIEIPVEMSTEQKRLYNEMKRDFITYYESNPCVAPLALTKLMRLMELCSGFVTVEKDTGREKKVLKDNPKLDALRELLIEIFEDPKAKVIVWSVFVETYEMIRGVFDELKIKLVEVHGGISAAQKRINVDTFNSDPDVRGFIGHPGSGGIGINLVIAAYDVTYSRSYSLADHLQAESRNHRGGAKEMGHSKITHYDLTINDSVDQLATKVLANKEDMSEKVLKQIARELMK